MEYNFNPLADKTGICAEYLIELHLLKMDTINVVRREIGCSVDTW
jgi:hypothetical protein